MATLQRDGALSRRLRELEEEERRLRQSMKDVSRHLRKLERGEADAHSAYRPPPPSAPDAQPVQAPPPQRVETSQGTSPRGDQRFASYFTSGSFVKTKPLARVRRTQRNQAILLAIFAALAAFIVIRIIF